MQAAETNAAPPLCCVTKNVGGLSSDAAKRQRLFHQLRSKRSLDLVLLQETHSSDDAAVRRWMAEAGNEAWRGQAFWHHGTSASRGVAVLVRGSSAVKDAKVTYKDTSGRILRVEFMYAGLHMAVVNVYAPSVAAERAAFFRDALPLAMDGGGAVLLAGDFNCVCRAEDRVGSTDSEHRFAGRNELEAFMVVHELEDSWSLPCRRGLPHRNAHTFHTNVRAQSGGLVYTAARLDRWLAHVSLRPWVVDTVIHPLRDDYLPGDHGAVVLSLKPPQLPPCGPGVWSLPLWVLNEDEYIAAVKQAVAGFRRDNAGLSARDLWEGVKELVADVSRSFCLSAEEARRQPERLARRTARLAESVCRARPDDCTLALAQLKDAEARLAALHDEESAKAKQASDILWQDYGEQGTFWFHRLAHQHSPLDPSQHVVGPDGVRLSFAQPHERAAAEDCVADHYQGLFATAATDVQAQDALLAATPERLSAEARADAEGPGGSSEITLDCLHEAVKSAPRGKRPGSDGLPFEFYTAFFKEVGPLLVAAAHEAFADEASDAPLSSSQRLGLIVRVYKGGGKPRDRCESYRPITLLNCDYKLIARVLASRLNGPANDILAVTQTAFVPGRDIVDNVLFHLEEVDWLESGPAQEQRQGCLVFLDFEKAYDRADRGWLMRCLQHFGFGAGCRRWVQVLLAGTGAQVLINGFRSRRFAMTSGMAQGSPLSPLLFNICQQPLAAYFLHLQKGGLLRGIPLPGGQLAPPTHQHADDTTLHLLGIQDLVPALQAVQLFCDATNARLNVDKTRGLLLGSHPQVPLENGVHVASGVAFVPHGEHVKHLGVLLARPDDQDAAAKDMHAGRLRQMYAVARQWAPFSLSYVGRAYIAKQCMASVLYYHAQFVRPPQRQLDEMCGMIARFVARPGGVGAGEDARTYMIHPQLAAASLPREEGGMAVVDIRTQLDALQAKLVARMSHPRRHPWKVIMSAAVTAGAPKHLGAALPYYPQAHLPRRAAAGRAKLSQRHIDYLAATRRTAPHRSMKAAEMSFHQVMLEPFLDNQCVRLPHSQLVATALTVSAAMKASLDRLNIHRLRDLRVALQGAPGDAVLHQLLACLPVHWRAHVMLPITPPAQHYTDTTCKLVVTSLAFAAHGTDVFGVLEDGRLGDVALRPAVEVLAAMVWQPCCVLTVDKPVALMSRAERDDIKAQLQAGAPRDSVVTPQIAYFVGLWDSLVVTPDMWSHGGRSLLRFSVRCTAVRARRLRAIDKVPGYVAGSGICPKAWGPSPAANVGAVGEAPGAGVAAPATIAALSQAGAPVQIDGHVGPSAAAVGGVAALGVLAAAPSVLNGGPPPHGGLSSVESRWCDALIARGNSREQADGAGPSDPAAAAAARQRRQFAQGWEPDAWLRSTFRAEHDPDLGEDTDLVPVVEEGGALPEADGIARRVRARREAQRSRAGGTFAPVVQPVVPDPVGDDADLAAGLPRRSPNAGRQAWLRLMSTRLPRDCKAIGWRVLHASLYTGVFWAYVTGRNAGQACCASPACAQAGTLETMQHLFLSCPDVSAAADWLCKLWPCVAPGQAAPPVSAAVLLADDHRVWQPQGTDALKELWTTLRLAWLHAVWGLRCRRAADAERNPVSAAAIVGATVATVGRHLRRDFARTVGDARVMSSAPRHWFRGTSVPTLSVDAFLARWGFEGALCTVTPGNGDGQGRRLVVTLSSSSPVALIQPAAAPAAAPSL